MKNAHDFTHALQAVGLHSLVPSRALLSLRGWHGWRSMSWLLPRAATYAVAWTSLVVKENPSGVN